MMRTGRRMVVAMLLLMPALLLMVLVLLTVLVLVLHDAQLMLMA